MRPKYPYLCFTFQIIAAILYLLTSCNRPNIDEKSVVDNRVVLKLSDPTAMKADWPKDSAIVIQVTADPDNLHPANGTSLTRLEINQYIHGSLLYTDLRNAEISPGICDSLPIMSSDHLSLTFHLRKQVRWDDGSAVTAKDVEFTLKAAVCPLTENPGLKDFFRSVENITINPEDSLQFTIKMRRPYIQNLVIWTDYPIIQQSFFDPQHILSHYTLNQFNDTLFNTALYKDLSTWASEFNSQKFGFDPKFIAGCGPYKVSEWVQGQYIRLERKPNHWTVNSGRYNEQSIPPSITFRINRDPSAQILEFKSQTVDGSTSLSTRTLLNLKTDSAFNRNYHSAFMNTYGYTYIALNTKPAESGRALFFNDSRVRKAFAMLTPVDTIIKIVNSGVNQRVNGPVAPIKKSYNESLKLIRYNVKGACELLDKAGWKDGDHDGIREKIIDGKKVNLTPELGYLSTIPEWKEMASIIEQAMSPAGIKLQLTSYDFQLWNQRATSHNFDMLMGSWNSTALPEDYSQLWSFDNWKNNGLNFTGFGNAYSDSLINKINITEEEKSRIAIEKELQEIIYNEQPYIFMYELVRRCVLHKRFKGGEFYAERPGALYNLLSTPSHNAVSPLN